MPFSTTSTVVTTSPNALCSLPQRLIASGPLSEITNLLGKSGDIALMQLNLLAQARRRNDQTTNWTPNLAMRKPHTLLAFRELRKKLEFVLPVDAHVQNNFRVAKVLLRRRRGYGRKLVAVIR